MVEEGFNEKQLYGSQEILRLIRERQREVRELAGVLAGQAEVEIGLLELVAAVVNSQAFNIFLFILKNAPVTSRRIKMEFPPTTVDRYLPQLEAVGAVEHHNYRYRVRRRERKGKKREASVV